MMPSLNRGSQSVLVAVVLVAVVLLAVACESDRSPSDPHVASARDPVLGLNQGGGTTPVQANGLRVDGGSCLGNDAVNSSLVNGVRSVADLNCSSSDISIGQISIVSYSTDGTTFIPVQAGQPISCSTGQRIFIDMYATLLNKSNSARTDIGIWVSYDGGDAITGSCSHYSLPAGQGLGTFNLDGDGCGDLVSGAVSIVQFTGLLSQKVALQCDDHGTGFLQIGTCLGWKQPGSDAYCPLDAGSETDFRYGTLPGGKSKCNCQATQIPVLVTS